MKTLYWIAGICLVTLILYHTGYLLYVGIGITVIICAIVHNDNKESKAHKAHLNTKEGAAEYVSSYVAAKMGATETPEDYAARKYLGRGRIDHTYIQAEIALDLEKK